MANTSVPISQLQINVFRVGRVFDRTISVYTRNFLPFSLVTLIASAPPLLLTDDSATTFFNPVSQTASGATTVVLVVLLSLVLLLLSQAILVHGAFQSMRGRRVNLQDSVSAALARFFPILGLIILVMLAFFLIFVVVGLIMMAVGFGMSQFSQNTGLTIVSVLVMIGTMVLLFVAILMLVTRWFVAVPVCMVERGGPVRSLTRSSQLTKGHRWKVFGIILLMYFGISFVGQFFILAVNMASGRIGWIIASLAWNTIWGAFFAIFVVVTYYELRSAKEGVDVDQVASVFD